jgi:hypothetical protein
VGVVFSKSGKDWAPHLTVHGLLGKLYHVELTGGDWKRAERQREASEAHDGDIHGLEDPTWRSSSACARGEAVSQKVAERSSNAL